MEQSQRPYSSDLQVFYHKWACGMSLSSRRKQRVCFFVPMFIGQLVLVGFLGDVMYPI